MDGEDLDGPGLRIDLGRLQAALMLGGGVEPAEEVGDAGGLHIRGVALGGGPEGVEGAAPQPVANARRQFDVEPEGLLGGDHNLRQRKRQDGADPTHRPGHTVGGAHSRRCQTRDRHLVHSPGSGIGTPCDLLDRLGEQRCGLLVLRVCAAARSRSGCRPPHDRRGQRAQRP